MNEIKFEILKRFGTISASRHGWRTELNLVSWNGNKPKVDIRQWSEDYERMTKGITFTQQEIERLYVILTEALVDQSWQKDTI